MTDASRTAFSFPLPWLVEHPDQMPGIEEALGLPGGAIARAIAGRPFDNDSVSCDLDRAERGSGDPSWLRIRIESCRGGGFDAGAALCERRVPFLHDWSAGSEYGSGAEAALVDGRSAEVMTNNDSPVVHCDADGRVSEQDREAVKRYAAILAGVTALAVQPIAA